ncbi:hypothetical protein L6R52_24835 [Myxococcota bacterium]|nr:hypothetical protein [Myxococcota bacterium]
MGGFFSQPSRAYRDFQIAFTVLTLNFTLPALSYIFAPEIAAEQLSQINELLGGGPYTAPESESRVWRYLGSANVMTLGLMCFLLQLDLRRYYATLFPLTFLKAFNATLFVGGFITTGAPMFLAVAIFDYVTSVAFVFFARRAHRDVAARRDDALVPRPWSARRAA